MWSLSLRPRRTQANPQRMDVLYKITEGQRVFVNRVLVTGLNFTRPYIVESPDAHSA